MKYLSAPIVTAVWFVVSLTLAGAAAPDLIKPPSSIPPSTPSSSSSSSSDNNDIAAAALHLLNVNTSLSLLPHQNFTTAAVNIHNNALHFHIPDTPFNLTITTFGRPLVFARISTIVDIALNDIASNVDLRPTEPITDGFFRLAHDGLEISIYRYVGVREGVINWYWLHQLLLGIGYWESRDRRPCEVAFEIVMMEGHDEDEGGIVGYGSLWDRGRLVIGDSDGDDFAKRAVNKDISSAQRRRINTRP